MHHYRFGILLTHLGFAIALVLLALLLGTSGVLAQETVDPVSGITLDEVNEVARELWCPLCSGVRLDACELKACIQMKEMIAIQLAEGEDLESIKAYFVDQYGPQVLGEPPREGFNWLAWILPVIVMVLGGVFLWRQMGRMMQPSSQAESTTSTAHTRAEGIESVQQDEYNRKLDEELARYG